MPGPYFENLFQIGELFQQLQINLRIQSKQFEIIDCDVFVLMVSIEQYFSLPKI
jgi:hypothetical protein